MTGAGAAGAGAGAAGAGTTAGTAGAGAGAAGAAGAGACGTNDAAGGPATWGVTKTVRGTSCTTGTGFAIVSGTAATG